MTFRLLNVQSGSISVHALADSPPYVAVSHAWSENLFPQYASFLESQGREAIVCVIREKFPSISLCWVDTICINQHDDRDKRMQIPLMGRIFGGAVAVAMLLTCEIGLDQATVDDFTIKLQGAVLLHEEEIVNEDAWYWQNGDGRALIVQGMRGLARLTTTAWTTRVWTLQEYILAQKVVWIGSDLQPIEIQDILFAALPDVCDTLVITECIGGEFERLYGFFSGMANMRLGRGDRTRVMELLGNRRATVEVDEVYGVMAASGVEIAIASERNKEEAWEAWIEQAVKSGHVRWLLMPQAIASLDVVGQATVNCIIPPFSIRHKVSSGSALDTVRSLGTVDVHRGTVSITGRRIGYCRLLTKLGVVHEPTPNRIHRDITLILFGRGRWKRAQQVASAFGGGRYNLQQLTMIARTLADNFGRAMKAVIARSQVDFRPRFRSPRQESVWSDFMALQMGIMPGMNDGIAYLGLVRHEHISIYVVVVLGSYKPMNALEVIDVGGRTVDDRCIFMIVERQPIASPAATTGASGFALHKVAVTLPVTGDYEPFVKQLPLQSFNIGGTSCWYCGLPKSKRQGGRRSPLRDPMFSADLHYSWRRAALERLSNRLHARRIRLRASASTAAFATKEGSIVKEKAPARSSMKIRDARLRIGLSSLRRETVM